ncbi:c-type cytochrome [Helicobacter muridarum]|uniref:Cytochrome C oxidase subunit III n=2 Tax=Helicobacter muridarum TaxID=216 RepID=A0A377PW20_9HELI|nr:c-type cytochrome [Helicobacter muridarum]STQ86614.1 cytochrome C oxidase subunit III [Helicobacter muridarum]
MLRIVTLTLVCMFFTAFIVFANSLNITGNMESDIETNFITQEEYGKQLYNSPRGISCKICHGEYGKGMQLAQYKHKGKPMEIYAPDITDVDISVFKRKLRSNSGVMPKYYLTDSEMEAIYQYIAQK